MASPIMRDPQYGGRLSMMQQRMQPLNNVQSVGRAMGTSDGGGAGRARGQTIFNNQGREQLQEVPQIIEELPERQLFEDTDLIISDPASAFGRVLVPDSGYTPPPPPGVPPAINTGNNPGWSWGGGFNPQPTENQNPILPTGGNPYSGGSSVDDKVYGGLGLTGLLSGKLGDALRTAGGYYAGQQGIEGAYQTGLTGLETAERMGQRALEGTQFKPFGVTSDLANVQVGAQGDVNLGLSGQQQRLQNQLLGGAGQMAGRLGAGYDPRTGQVGRQAMGQAQQQIGQVGAYDPSIAAQRGAMGGLFGQQLGQFGQPTGLEGVTQAGLMGAQQQFGRAGQPQDIQDLRSQYGSLAMQAGQGLLTSPEQRQSDIYESIRATQRPEEERQALRMRENLLAQGRAGVRTADYGGTPEQLAMAKAQAEAQAGAALRAREMGMAEQQQGLQTAQTLTGMTSGLAGLGSELETAGIGRGATLAGLGMQGAQMGRGFGQQDLQNLMALQGADIGAAQAQQALQQGRLGLGSGLFGLGQQAQMMPSQLRGADIQNMQALLSAGYIPQQQALNLLQAGMPAAEMSQRGQLSGTELQSKLGSQGLEMYMGGADMANRLQQQQLQGMLGSALGQGMTMEEQLLAALTGRDPQSDEGLLGALGVGEGKTPEIIKSIGDYFGFGGGNNNDINNILPVLFSGGGGSTSTGGLGGGGSNATGGFLTGDLFGGMSSGNNDAFNALLEQYGGG